MSGRTARHGLFKPSVSDGPPLSVLGPTVQTIDDMLPAAGVSVGDLLYWDGDEWQRLAPGTSEDILECRGVSAPAWTPRGGSGIPLKPVTNRWGKPGFYAYSSLGTLVAAGDLYYAYMPVERPISMDQIGVNVNFAAAAGSLARIGVYTCVNGAPDALVTDAGTVATDSNGNKTIANARTLYGEYFTCIVFDNAPFISGIDIASAGFAGVTGMSTSMGTQPYQTVLKATGKAALVAAGLPATATAYTAYDSIELDFVRIRWTN